MVRPQQVGNEKSCRNQNKHQRKTCNRWPHKKKHFLRWLITQPAHLIKGPHPKIRISTVA